jgi:hypothetical protein
MRIVYGKLSDIPVEHMLALVNHPGIVAHMPFASPMDEVTCRNWAAAKDAQWQENGYGPWAIHVDGRFVGWGGFQREGDDVDLALVLLPEQWGVGPGIVRDLIGLAWSRFGFASIMCLLPPSRTRLKPLARLGFVADGSVDWDGQTFLRFRMFNPARPGRSLPGAR